AATAKEQGLTQIHYGVVDLNRDVLERDAYDVIVAHAVLHHVENLEHAYAQIEQAMKPDATLLVNEYVGPSRFQFSDDVLRILNALLDCIRRGETRTRPSVEEMIANDPTEAVRSEELLGFTERHFDIRERKDLGGTILQHLLYGIVQHYRFDVPRERGVIDMLCAIEGMLVDAQRIASDFVLLAARKRGSNVTKTNRPLPSRAEGASDIEPDPLRLPYGRRAARAPRVPLRLLRIALASQQQRRANLFAESHFYAFRERLLGMRMPDDPTFRRLIETAATLAHE
ncbi:MAG TPA: class I SAM-dependent methyltransferase, partial [Thermoanaerobaculia bacterium]|nr:class I SAM-dependent methyltransferase [Thermoanaerobaculia bacterium]